MDKTPLAQRFRVDPARSPIRRGRWLPRRYYHGCGGYPPRSRHSPRRSRCWATGSSCGTRPRRPGSTPGRPSEPPTHSSPPGSSCTAVRSSSCAPRSVAPYTRACRRANTTARTDRQRRSSTGKALRRTGSPPTSSPPSDGRRMGRQDPTSGRAGGAGQGRRRRGRAVPAAGAGGASRSRRPRRRAVRARLGLGAGKYRRLSRPPAPGDRAHRGRPYPCRDRPGARPDHGGHARHQRCGRRARPAVTELGEADGALRVRLQAEYIAVARRYPATREQASRRLRRLSEHAQPGSLAGCVLLANLAADALESEGAAEQATRLADAALREEHLLVAEELDVALLATSVLMSTDRLDTAWRVWTAAVERARRWGSITGFAGAATIRACLAYRCGQLMEAEADARLADDMHREYGHHPLRRYSVAFLVGALVERGEVRAAADVLDDSAVTVNLSLLLDSRDART